MSGWPTGPTHRYFLHLDSIRIIHGGESGCDKCVTNVWQAACHTLVTQLVTSVFVHPAVRKLRKLICETQINNTSTQQAGWIRFSLPWDRIHCIFVSDHQYPTEAARMGRRSRLVTQRQFWSLCVAYRTHPSILLASGFDRNFWRWRIWVWQVCDKGVTSSLSHICHKSCHSQILHPE